MPRQEAVREHAHIGIQDRIDWHCDYVTREMHLLAFRWQLANSPNALTHEMPVGHTISAIMLHGLGAFIRHEGDKDQPGDQDKR